jgi:hypothetical protein
VVTLLEAIVGALFAALRPRASLVIENLALRQQLSILRRSRPRPRLRPLDRAFWVVLYRTWSPRSSARSRRPTRSEDRAGAGLCRPRLGACIAAEVISEKPFLTPAPKRLKRWSSGSDGVLQ